MKRARLLISNSVLVMMIGGIFLAVKPELSSAQDGGFRTYKLVVYCGNSGVATVIFGHEVTTGGTQGRPLMGTHSICAGDYPGCGTGGTVSLEAALAGLPAQVSAALKAKVDKHQENAAAGKGRPLTCLRDDKKPPSKKKCEKPTPWFGNSSNCSEVQSPVIAINAGAVTLTMCGYPVFRWVPPDPKDESFVYAYKTALRDQVQARVGSKICCDKLREAARTGTPCYPGYDVDCDGKPNQTDVDSANPDFPDINNLFSKEGEAIDPFPAGLDPDDPNFLPPPEKCDCKWELVKGTLNCSRDGKRPHFYQARWRCPSTGNETFTRKEAPATAPCP
jgi:hypothetical protein